MKRTADEAVVSRRYLEVDASWLVENFGVRFAEDLFDSDQELINEEIGRASCRERV